MTALGTTPPALGPTRVLVDGENSVLDARLALFHRTERWLAVADVHFGYELSQRAAGGLFPMWGMDTIEARLRALLEEYRPAQLIVAGDFVHDRAARDPALALLERLRVASDENLVIVLVAGNHDRRAFAAGEMRSAFVTDRFYFHHGDGSGPSATELGNRTAIIGHHHPAGTLRDGAGLSLKLPAFVQTPRTWVLPAFSPWAAGGGGRFGRDARTWLCSPKRILPPR